MPQKTGSIAIVHPSGLLRISTEEIRERLATLATFGFEVTDHVVTHPSPDGWTAGPALERAALLAHALTSRKNNILWAARGGYGVTSLIPFLEEMLPPILPAKMLVGFSDISFLGCWLAQRYPNLSYIHASHAFEPKLFTQGCMDWQILNALISGNEPKPITFPITHALGINNTLSGPCVPLNLSLATSLSALRNYSLPPENLLFLEDINEELYQLLRNCDTLSNSGFLAHTQAIVLGQFSSCNDAQGNQVKEEQLVQLFHSKTRLPVISFPAFGHADSRLPLRYGANVSIAKQAGKWTLKLAFQPRHDDNAALSTNHTHETLSEPKGKRIHFTGIGGTGMAAVAGIFASAGYEITGSDGPIYPPMDKVIADLGIKPAVGYRDENITAAKPDFIVLSNVITRTNAELKTNPELECILDTNAPMLSFPSALRHFFLNRAKNIVVTGTHGKTTTSALISQSLDYLGLNPSFFIGGATRNFKNGFRLASRELFVLEGDEYDTAFFDKGPKFLHYEPSIALMNNIEFDHADIYPDIDAIEREFIRLAKLTSSRNGVVAANWDEPRVRSVCQKTNPTLITFGETNRGDSTPHWTLLGFCTHAKGIELEVLTPAGQKFSVKTNIFGHHNAMNSVATLAVLHARDLIAANGINQWIERARKPLPIEQLQRWSNAIESFLGVRRRFELVGLEHNIAVFDDFAHHPTAIETTLAGFRAYMDASKRNGRLIACFDPRNATMRRRVLQQQLAESFATADLVCLGKVPQDLRLKSTEQLDGPAVVQLCGSKARYFDDNNELCDFVHKTAQEGDTVVFMSSGAFDGLPSKLVEKLRG